MQTEHLIAGYDVDAKTPALIHHEAGGVGQWPEADELAAELEQKGRFFGKVISDVVKVAGSVREFETKEEGVAQIDDDTYKLFAEYYAPEMKAYFDWVLSKIGGISSQIQEWEKSSDPAFVAHLKDLFSHRNFHALNGPLEQQWFDFLSNGPVLGKPSREAQLDSLNGLAFEGVLIIRHRELSLVNSGARRSDYLSGISLLDPTRIEGTLNEIDAGIALLQASLNDENGGWWVLPAPPQFEYLVTKQRRADYLLIDTSGDRGVGVQIKSSGVGESSNGENGYVFTLSGRHDLGNTFALPNEERGQGFKDYNYAGSLALAAVSRFDTKSPIYKEIMELPVFRWGIGYAKQRGRPRHLESAARNVAYRVNSHL